MAIFGYSDSGGNARPSGGFGSYGTPSKTKRAAPSNRKANPSGAHGSYGPCDPHKPMGKYGSRGKPGGNKANRGSKRMGNCYTEQQLAGKVRYKRLLNVGIPKGPKTGRAVVPKGKFVGY